MRRYHSQEAEHEDTADSNPFLPWRLQMPYHRNRDDRKMEVKHSVESGRHNAAHFCPGAP